MQQGDTYNETFAPVPNISTMRLLFALGAKNNWEIKQGDVATAFLCASMDTEVYVSIPKWFSNNPAEHRAKGFTIHRLLKAVPGIPQGPRLWNNKSHAAYTKQGLTRCKSDHSLYVCNTRHLYLIIWVDDLFFFFPTKALIHAKALWKSLQKDLPLDDWEDVEDCLGVKVTRDRPALKLTLSQQAPLEKLLLKAGMTTCSPEHTPLSTQVRLSKEDCPKPSEALTMADEQRAYRSILASLIYFYNWTRPSIGYTISKLCRFMHNPGQIHFTCLKRLLRYLSTTRETECETFALNLLLISS